MAPGDDVLVTGAVAYDAKVVTIWEGFRRWFAANGLPFDYVLYSNYERQVEALAVGEVHVAWNSPLAWIRSERLARATGREARALAMRDTDCDLTSVVVVRTDSRIEEVPDLLERTVGVGAVD
ncbi:MAG TPA: PhnD/SsuA/transferrin family substrate-binding protein, partial [Acidimicrobiales bacterium]|nr:PhnD/SsuA/transferrin family substrate-binding protein [Acidimicrobiales bacterium]